MDFNCNGCGASASEHCSQDCVISNGTQGFSDGWRWERCSKCDCCGHCFDGDLPHTTLACEKCGTCEACADCDGCDGLDAMPVPETVTAAGVATADTASDDPLPGFEDALADLQLATEQAAAFQALDQALERLDGSRSAYLTEHRDLQARAFKIAGKLARANYELLVALRERGDVHRVIAEHLDRKYEGSVPPVDVGHGEAEGYVQGAPIPGWLKPHV